MRLIVALHHHFRKSADGKVYPYHVFDYGFWQSYLEVFDEVCVFARMGKVSGDETGTLPASASGPGVSFIELPDFQGIGGYFKAVKEIRRIACDTFNEPAAYLLRPPSFVCDILWRELIKRDYPYAVEVVGDPWDAYSPGSVSTPLRPFIRRIATNRLKKQCIKADLASYVTKFGLQKRYPAGHWSTHFSDIILRETDIAADAEITARIARYRNLLPDSRIRLCTVGSLWHLAKAQDVLISSVSCCLNKGLNLELVIVGDGSYKEKLQKQAETLGISDRVIFAGHLSPGRDVFNELDKADIYVLPSRQEGLPRSVIEAMARGLPCITSNVSGLPELVKAKWLVVPEDIDGLANKITEMVSKPEEMVRLTQDNHEHAQEYEFGKLQVKRVVMYKKLKELTLGN